MKSEMKRAFSALAFFISFVTDLHQEIPFHSYLVIGRPFSVTFLMLHSTNRTFYCSHLYELSIHVSDPSETEILQLHADFLICPVCSAVCISKQDILRGTKACCFPRKDRIPLPSFCLVGTSLCTCTRLGWDPYRFLLTNFLLLTLPPFSLLANLVLPLLMACHAPLLLLFLV